MIRLTLILVPILTGVITFSQQEDKSKQAQVAILEHSQIPDQSIALRFINAYVKNFIPPSCS